MIGVDRTFERTGDRASDKSPEAFRTISEVAEDLDVPQHVLRFWETRFGSIRPLKRGGGRRYYRPDDVDLLKGIRHLLYSRGYTIKGVQRIIKEDGPRFVQALGRGEQGAVASVQQAPKSESRGDETDERPAEGTMARASDEPFPSSPSPAWAAEVETQVDGRPPLGSGSHALDPQDVQRLRSVLAELCECRRMLGTLRAE